MYKSATRPFILLFALLVSACATNEGDTSDAESSKNEMSESISPGPNVIGEEISYELDGTSLTGYIAYDENIEGTRPGVIVVHQWWGHSSYVRMRADMLAEMGYTALALDLYGDGKYAEHPEDARKFMMEVSSNMDVGEARFRIAKQILEDHATTDAEKIAAIGYCFGGGVVLHMAKIGSDLDGVASFHGSLNTVLGAEPGAIKAKLLVLHGAEDKFTQPGEVERFKEAMTKSAVEMRFVSYPGAEHGFTDPAATEKGEEFEIPLAYQEEADKKSWAELDAFLVEVFE